MAECSKVNVILTDAQLKKLKTAVKDKVGTTLGISLKMFDGNDLPFVTDNKTKNKTKKCI